MDNWLIILVVSQICFVAFVLWLVANFGLNKMRQRSEERLRILERFTSSEELSEFLNTPSGSTFAHLFSAPPADPRRVIVPAVGVGSFMVFLGTGLYIFEWATQAGAFDLPAGLAIVTGLSVLLSAAVSHILTGALHRPGHPGAVDPGHEERS